MKSILDNRPELAHEVNKVAEVAGYLWQKGWAERNGGNITVNITEYADDEIRNMPAISEVKQIGVTLPHLKGCYFYCKGTNMRMRDLARRPMDNGSVIRILDDCASYVITALHRIASSIAFFIYLDARSMSPLSKISLANIFKERFSLAPFNISEMADIAKYLIVFS